MSDAGKYRWMTAEEAIDELDQAERCWIYSRALGKVLGTFYLSAALSLMKTKRDRICRALVPEAPTE